MNKNNFWKNIAKGMMRFEYLDVYEGLDHDGRLNISQNETYPYLLIIDKKTKIVYSCPFEGDGILDLMESV